MDNFNIKIKEIMNDKNMKIVIPVIVLVVLLIVVFVYLKEYQYNNYRDKKEFELYQYFGEQKVIYDATISYNKKGVIKAFVPSRLSTILGLIVSFKRIVMACSAFKSFAFISSPFLLYPITIFPILLFKSFKSSFVR